MRLNDAVIGVVLLVFAVAMIAYTRTFPGFSGQRYGPDLFPILIGVGLIVTSSILIGRGLRARASVPWIELAAWTRSPRHRGSFALVLALLAFYILAADWLGFLAISSIILVVLFLWLGVRPWVAMVVAIVSTLAIQGFFGQLMRIPLPRGLLDLFY